MANTVVYKYEIDKVVTDLVIPGAKKVLTSKVVNERIYIWVWVDLDDPTEHKFRFYTVPTGANMEGMPAAHYLTTVFTFAGLVFHIFYNQDVEIPSGD